MADIRAVGSGLKDPDDDEAFQLLLGDVQRLKQELRKGSNAGYGGAPIGGVNEPVDQSEVEITGGTISGLTTPLDVPSGGTGGDSAVAARYSLKLLCNFADMGSPTGTYTSGSGTHTWNTAKRYAMIIIQGAGGGGGGYRTTGESGGGGGAGAISYCFLDINGLGSTSYSVGAAGSAGGTGANGTNGGDTTFGSFTAEGGRLGAGGDFGGSGGDAGRSNNAGSGIHFRGGQGQSASVRVIAVGPTFAYYGGLGGNGVLRISGTTYGAGGLGGGNSGGGPGAGGGGAIIVYEF